MGFHLAVDGGNSKTVAVVVDDTGEVRGRGRAGCCDIYSTATPEEGASAVLDAVRQALAEAGEPTLSGAAFRLASCDWDEDIAWWTEQLRSGLPASVRPAFETMQVGNDALSSLRLGDLSGVGVSVVIGTGPALGARSPQGREAWSGVWIFDSMGGIGLSDEAMAAVCRAWLGIAPETALTQALLELFDEPDVWQLTHSFRRRFEPRDPSELRRAARAVMQVAAAGDPVAQGIVAEQARLFAEYARAIAAQAGIDAATDRLPVVVNGSVATSEHGVLRDALRAALAERFPGSPIIVADAPPIAGVALDALAAGGVALTAGLRATIAGTVHPSGFLTT